MNILIDARDLMVGDTILDSNKQIQVAALETGPNCTGIHVNVVRRETRAIKDGKGKVIGLNPDRGRILHTDGCYAPCMRIVVQRDAD